MPIHQRGFHLCADTSWGADLDGRQGPVDGNVFIERLWRSLKYECVYLHAFQDGLQARQAIDTWLQYYNEERPHSTFAGDRTPMEEYSRLRRAA